MIDNSTLRAIRERRSVRNFTSESVTDEQLEAILEAARWAPSRRNSQPWDFVVARDPMVRAELGNILKRVTWAWGGFASAPALIVVSVDRSRDPEHFVEDGAVAAQNLCLAAQSLGLASSWAGVYARGGRKKSVERSLQKLLGLPRTHRVIAVVPVGTAGRGSTTSRRPLGEMVHHDRFGARPYPRSEMVEPAVAYSDEGTHQLARPSRRRSLTKPGKFQ